jgi:hypothetical protein
MTYLTELLQGFQGMTGMTGATGMTGMSGYGMTGLTGATGMTGMTGAPNLDNGGATGQMAFWDGAKWTNTETSELVWDDTNKRLGIAMAIPLHPLDVRDTVGLSVGADGITRIGTKSITNALASEELTVGGGIAVSNGSSQVKIFPTSCYKLDGYALSYWNGASVVNAIQYDSNGLVTIVKTFKSGTGVIVDNDATPDVSGANTFVYAGSANAVTITDLDSPVVGAVYVLIGNSDTYTISIADSGNFKLAGVSWVGGLDDSITLYCKADNYYIELCRSNN